MSWERIRVRDSEMNLLEWGFWKEISCAEKITLKERLRSQASVGRRSGSGRDKPSIVYHNGSHIGSREEDRSKANWEKQCEDASQWSICRLD